MNGVLIAKVARLVHYYRDLLRPSGVTAAIHGWQKALVEIGTETVALHAGPSSEWQLPSFTVPHYGTGRQLSVPMLSKYLVPGDVLVIHEGWVASNLFAAMQARRLGIPYIVVPHGVYEPQILKHLKSPYYIRKFLEKRLLNNAANAHLFYESEIEYVKRLAPDLDTFAVPTGLPVSTVEWMGGGGYIAWFGRYSVEHKGIDRLLASYALVPPAKRLPLRLNGIDYRGGKAETIKLVETLGLSDWVSVGGPVHGSSKDDLLRYCDGFMFSSRWESQGISLLEAISMGAPALVSDSVHVASSLHESRAAYITDFSDFYEASLQISQFPRSDHVSSRTRSYVEKNLNWTHLAKNYMASIKHLING